ncbi:acetyltransferase [Streptomyces rimosus subsp. pseudoverticillatus]|uniref:GNAT family N-acetyltransferase n=1 Tax=Streptomyces rimosus TaxID=1927 RepID=UPI0006B27AE1|nr:GNAT family N-acetyltransferase [Streptomyces rimosus]KOT90109.1 acetyltransferase [Streptomyces rimosus subsp. pseudoverticillatus]
MQIMSFPEAATPYELRAQVQDLQDEAWPSTDAPAPDRTAPTHDPALQPLSMLLVEAGTVLAALDILSKPLQHAGRGYRAGGLSTVVTRREARGRGHGRHLVAAARTAMAASGLDVGVFTCDRPLASFYESAGWQRLTDTVLIGGTPRCPFPSDQPGFDKVTLADFFTDSARQHRHTFEHTRLELYPGEIDKLW